MDRPAVSALINAGAKKESIEACLALEIAKIANMITAGGNLRQGQALEIAQQLLAEYPNESLEDFCLCLRRGIKGQYGDIFRFDVMVIFGWFAKYLEEKYQAIENNLMREKDSQYTAIMLPDPSLPESEAQTLTEEIKREKVKERLKAWREAVEAVQVKAIAPLSKKEMEAEGKEKPKATPYPVTSESEAMKHELHLEWARKNFDPRTGDKLPTFTPENVWLESLSKEDKKQIFNKAKI